MPTTTRTYLPTDWQLWVYTPVSGIWRWDFSEWDGGDDWGTAGQTGSMSVIDTEISSIELTDGLAPSNSVLGNVMGGSMTLTGRLNNWNSSFIAELYNGKEVTLTLKNQSDYDTDTYGRNSVMFHGTITGCSTIVNPDTKDVIFTITADDYFGMALSQIIAYQTSTIDPKALSIEAALTTAALDGNLPGELYFLFDTFSDNTNEFDEATSQTVGAILTDFIAGEVGMVYPIYNAQSPSGGIMPTWREVYLKPLATTLSPTWLLEDDVITNITMGNDGGDRPTSFQLSNTTANVELGSNQSGYLANINTYSNTIDTTIQGLQYVISTIQTGTNKLSPLVVEQITATTFNPITFVYDTYNRYPDNLRRVGEEITVDSATLGETFDAIIVSTTHNIDPDNWITTLELSKGL